MGGVGCPFKEGGGGRGGGTAGVGAGALVGEGGGGGKVGMGVGAVVMGSHEGSPRVQLLSLQDDDLKE